MSNQAIFLDRDGVINEVIFRKGKPSSPWKPEEFRIYPDVKESLNRLARTKALLFVVTNQPDISKGFISEGTTAQINSTLMERFPIHEIAVCAHEDRHQCSCRKPKPGMLLDLAARWNVDCRQSFLIGDNWKDIEAGRAAGCRAILINKPYNLGVDTDIRVDRLPAAVTAISSILEKGEGHELHHGLL